MIRLMGTTPMRDWARGRLSGRLDRDRLLREAALPAPIGDLIARIVRKTRLWRLEKADVTRELIAHFRDGLDAGADPAVLATAFGDPKRAARLIRRAKRRNRPLPWRAMIYTRNTLAVLVLVLGLIYAGLALRYFTGRPSISRDFLTELNAPAAALSDEQRAWPIYREAMLRLTPVPDRLQFVEGAYAQVPADDPRKPLYREYLRGAQPALEVLARAVDRPRMGLLFSNQVDKELQDKWDRLAGRTPMETAGPSTAEGPPAMLIDLLLPSLGEIRHLARLLGADAQLAAEEGDRPRLARDLRAMSAMADHMSDHPFLIGQLVGVALLAHASDHLEAHLRDHPQLLDDDLLKELAHRLGAYGGGGHVRMLLTGEVAVFDDVMQHLFTDDGHGDGRLTPAGATLGQSMLTSQLPIQESGLAAWMGPIRMGLTASRAEIVRVHRLLMTDMAAYNERPLWVRAEPPALPESGALFNVRYWPIVALSPALDRIQYSADTVTQSRDAALTAIALELHRRRTGHYPSDLAELVPGLLPAIPLDQFDGRPMKYKMVNSGAVLYSVGVDRKDDGGRAPEGSTGTPSWQTPRQVAEMLKLPAARARIDGDWILFPPPRSPDVPPEDPTRGAPTD